MSIGILSAPAYLPPGYAFSSEVTGSDAGGLGLDPGQVGLFYRRGAALEDWRNPLVVYTGGPGAPDLVATERHTGESVDLGVSGVVAVYHDGLWVLGQGADQLQLGQVFVHWDASALHSVTVRWNSGTAAVRGPKGRGVGYDELIQVTKSLFDLLQAN